MHVHSMLWYDKNLSNNFLIHEYFLLKSWPYSLTTIYPKHWWFNPSKFFPLSSFFCFAFSSILFHLFSIAKQPPESQPAVGIQRSTVSWDKAPANSAFGASFSFMGVEVVDPGALVQNCVFTVRRYAIAVYAVVVCLCVCVCVCVCLSHSDIVSKWLNVGSRK